MKDLRERLGEIMKQMEAWKMLWKIDDETPGSFHEFLWGSQGQDQIQMSLMRISRSAQRIRRIIASQFEEGKDSTKFDKLQRIFQSHKRLRMERVRLAELHVHLKELAEAVDSLVAISQMRYLSAHQAPKETSRQSGSTTSLKNILMTRTHSQELYRCCHSSSPLSIYLHMDLFEDQHDSTFPNSDAKSSQPQDKLQYHLFIERSSMMPFTDFIVEGLEENYVNQLPKEEVDDIRQIQSIYEVLAISSTLTDAISKPHQAPIFSFHNSETDKTTYFYLRKPLTNLVLYGPPKNLGKFLTEVQYKPFYDSNHLLLDARYDLAFKIVKCGLYLLGTPWLSDLSSFGLLRATTSDKDDLYLLPVRTSDAPAESPWSQSLSTIDSQIFRIGILLIEIALETPLEPTELVNDNSPFLFKVTRQAAAEMGPDYGGAVRYCLERRHQLSLDDGDSDRLADRLALFHKNVYTPYAYSFKLSLRQLIIWQNRKFTSYIASNPFVGLIALILVQIALLSHSQKTLSHVCRVKGEVIFSR